MIERQRSDERGLSLLLFLAMGAIVLVAATSGAVAAFVFLRDDAHPSDEIAKLLPADTQIYLSINLRPGNDQLRIFGHILERFRENPDFELTLDDLSADGARETGIDIRDDVVPWLGPEIGVGIVDFVDTAITAQTGGVPPVVAVFGTTDRDRSGAVLQTWLAYMRDEDGAEFEEGSYKGFDTFQVLNEDQYYGLGDEHIVLATERRLLERTIDRIQGDLLDSLYEEARFQRARDGSIDPRFAMLYADLDAIWQDARRLLGDELPLDARETIEELVPEWTTLTASLVDKGLKLTVSLPADDSSERPAATDTLSAATRLPASTQALLAFAVEPNLGGLRQQLDEFDIEGLGELGDLPPGLGNEAIDGGSLNEALDEGLSSIRDAFGFDVERDIFAWMAGQFAIALLQTDFQAIASDPTGEAVHLVGQIQFEPESRDALEGLLRQMETTLNDELGLEPRSITYGGGDGATFDLESVAGPSAYRPGYLILGDQLVIASTDEALRAVAFAQSGDEERLADVDSFSRAVQEFPADVNPMLYLNVHDLVQSMVETLSPEDRAEYGREVEAFVEPIQALMMGAERDGDIHRFSIVLSIE